MGNFGGHALPGSFFIIFALWWTIQTFRAYYQSLSKGGQKYRSTVTSPCCCCPSKVRDWPWEGAVIIFFTAVGFTLEIITGFMHGKFVHIGNGQHATMFFFFGLAGFVSILLAVQWQAAPQGLDYAMMTLAFGVEALLFRVHIMGRPPLDFLLHTLLVYAVFACCAMCLLELKYPHNPLIRLARAYFTFLQGTWFWQIAFVLYNPMPGAVAWEDDDHDQMMIITMMFAWHMAVVLIIMLFIGAFIGTAFYCTGRLRIVQKQAGYNSLLPKHTEGRDVEEAEHSDTSL